MFSLLLYFNTFVYGERQNKYYRVWTFVGFTGCPLVSKCLFTRYRYFAYDQVVIFPYLTNVYVLVPLLSEVQLVTPSVLSRTTYWGDYPLDCCPLSLVQVPTDPLPTLVLTDSSSCFLRRHNNLHKM